MRHKEAPAIMATQHFVSVYPIPQSPASPQSFLAQEIMVKACIIQTIPHFFIKKF